MPAARVHGSRKFEHMASRYNLPFDLERGRGAGRLPAVHEAVRRRPVGRRHAHRGRRRAARPVRRLRPAADAPAGVGRGLRRLRRARSRSAPRRWSMHFDPDAPMHLRYEVEHDFLTPEIGWEVVTISRLVNAFFRWEFNSCESLVRGSERAPDRLRERLARRRADEPALLLPVGDGGARQVVRVLLRHRPAARRSTRTSASTSTSATATTSPTRTSCASTAGSPTTTSRSTSTRSSARRRFRTLRERRRSSTSAGPEFDALLVETVQSRLPGARARGDGRAAPRARRRLGDRSG